MRQIKCGILQLWVNANVNSYCVSIESVLQSGDQADPELVEK